MNLKTVEDAINYSIDDILIDKFWNTGDYKELRIHSIHAYPAKFPAFIATKAINFARLNGVSIQRAADIFCGCGTVALEARINNIEFWGCDINPVATLLAEVKSSMFNLKTLNFKYKQILNNVNSFELAGNEYETANERLKYWFSEEQYLDLFKYFQVIQQMPNSKYKKAFHCIFSSILKATSNWLSKSIKPQIDPNKKPVKVRDSFTQQYKKFINACKENPLKNDTRICIENVNFLKKRKLPDVNIIITSPPYVTSYEYADLHQLSSLWLGCVDDYRELRKGSIGSVYNSEDYFFKTMDLNQTGSQIIDKLIKCKAIPNAKIKSVARYYIDMQKTVEKCYSMLSKNSMAFFIVGDTEYKGIKIENARHLAESLLTNGFNEVDIVKRRISNKLLTPYRDDVGRFSTDKSNRTVYHEEYVIIGRKL